MISSLPTRPAFYLCNDFMTGDSLSLTVDEINRLTLFAFLVDAEPQRPAITCTIVGLLWVNTGHLSNPPSPPPPTYIKEVTWTETCLLPCIYPNSFMHRNAVMQSAVRFCGEDWADGAT